MSKINDMFIDKSNEERDEAARIVQMQNEQLLSVEQEIEKRYEWVFTFYGDSKEYTYVSSETFFRCSFPEAIVLNKIPIQGIDLDI